MVAWMAFLFETTKIRGDTKRQYVSSISMAYETSGLAPPRRPAGTKRLYHKVGRAIHGFTNARLRAGGVEPTQHSPTPDTLIGLLCDFVHKVLSAPVSAKSVSLALNALSNVWQYVMISRPTMTAAMEWSDLQLASDRELKQSLRRLAYGRKNKTATTKSFTRRILLTEPLPDRHPVSHIFRYHRAVSEFTTRLWLLWPKCVWQLPTEGLTTQLDSAAMNIWFKAAVKDAKIRHDEQVTARSHRSGSATAAFKVGVPVPVFSQVTDWDLSGKKFFKTYYRSQLDCKPALQRRFFADLLESFYSSFSWLPPMMGVFKPVNRISWCQSVNLRMKLCHELGARF
jgi:hypothetical protein